MPLDRRAAFQLGLLLLAVPAQYLVGRYMQTTEARRSHTLRKIFSQAVGFQEKYLSWRSWQKWCMELLSKVKTFGPQSDGVPDVDTDMGESPAIEVLKYRDPNGYFATSPEPRTPRPPNVKYRVGQVIKHKKWGYRGVIIGWDEVAKAPEDWLKEMHPADKAYWRLNPNYAVLVDTRDRMHPQMTYVVEENIQIISNIRVIHPMLEEYFEEFDGAQYLPRPWLKSVYPHD